MLRVDQEEVTDWAKAKNPHLSPSSFLGKSGLTATGVSPILLATRGHLLPSHLEASARPGAIPAGLFPFVVTAPARVPPQQVVRIGLRET